MGPVDWRCAILALAGSMSLCALIFAYFMVLAMIESPWLLFAVGAAPFVILTTVAFYLACKGRP